jgi:hypothetical protein
MNESFRRTVSVTTSKSFTKSISSGFGSTVDISLFTISVLISDEDVEQYDKAITPKNIITIPRENNIYCKTEKLNSLKKRPPQRIVKKEKHTVSAGMNETAGYKLSPLFTLFTYNIANDIHKTISSQTIQP